MTDRNMEESGGSVAKWYAWILAAVIAVTGVVMLGGGIWLASLGGSWYYLVAGVGLLATSLFLAWRRVAALWLYLATYLFTVIWAVWEVGLDGWAQVPRLVAPTALLLLVLLAIPAVRRGSWGRSGLATASVALVGLVGAFGVTHGSAPRLVAQEVELEEEEAVPDQPADASDGLEVATDAEPGPAVAADDEPDATGTPAAAPGESETAIGTEEADTTPTGVEIRAAAAPLETGADWPAYGGTYEARRYSPLAEITPENVQQLQRVWEFRSGDMPSAEADGKYSPENTPLKVGDDLYICTPMGIAISVDAATGREEWRYDPEVPVDAIPYGATCRGVAYYEQPGADPDDLCATRVIWGTLDARLIAVDARLGQPCEDFGENGEVYLEAGIGDTVPGWYSVTAAPVIVRGIVVTGAQVQDGQAEDSPSGVVRGYDAVSGELAWAWDLGNPDNRGAPQGDEVYTRGTPNMWTTAAADEERGLVFLPLGNSAVDYYGSNRSELENEYATSLVAVDVTTGEDVWHFQTVHHDVWDYDLGSQPSLIDFPTDEGKVAAILLSSKQGDIYVLDRETGEPLVPVEEREVPTDMGVEPGYLAETQPASTYHSLLFPALEEKDMWGMTPLDQLWCRIQFQMSNYAGPYTPPTTDGYWIQYPGYNGGQDWGSMAVDTERGILIANYNDMPNHNRLIPREEAGDAHAIFEPDYQPGSSEAGPQLGSPYAIDVNAGWRDSTTGLMCKEPPYGGLRAIDLESGETLWDVPLGKAQANGPFGIPSMLPLKIGTPNNGGPLVTAGGLIFIAAATDNLIRAVDIETGETVWSDVLPAGGQTTPISYSVGDRQFVAIAPGGHHFMETPVGDYLMAWALPVED